MTLTGQTKLDSPNDQRRLRKIRDLELVDMAKQESFDCLSVMEYEGGAIAKITGHSRDIRPENMRKLVVHEFNTNEDDRWIWSP